jgi:IclR family transcriptional regulator, KDG regulon repressor
MHRSVVKSASRTLEVLELFSEQRRPLRLHEIYEQLHYPQSSATHLLKSMLKMGYINYNRTTRTYLPTNKIYSLGNWLSSAAYGQSRYHGLSETISQRTDETVAISTQNDLFIQYMIIKAPQHEFKMPPPVGNMRLLTQSTSGMALLSCMSDRQVDKICRHINYYEIDPKNHADTQKVLRDLAWIRHVGYCYWEDHPDPGIASMAFPLGETLHGIPLAVGVGGIKTRLASRKMELVSILRETIAEFHEQSNDDVDDPGPPQMTRLPHELPSAA